MIPKTATPRIVVLQANRFMGDLLRNHIRDSWRGAVVEVYQKGFDALDSIQRSVPDIFIGGVDIEDMDGLEHFEPFIHTTLPILIVCSRKDARTLSLLREIRFDGIFDTADEDLGNLQTAIELAYRHQHYMSPSIAALIKRPRNITLDTLTDKEQMVLSVIGDGTDDKEAAEQLSLSHYTINTHRKAIMAKLKLHQKGELMKYAIKQGYVQFTSGQVYHPGFQRKIRDLTKAKCEPAK